MLKINTEKVDNFLAYFSSFPAGSVLFIKIKRNVPPKFSFDAPGEKKYMADEFVLHYQGASVYYFSKEEDTQTNTEKLVDVIIAKANENKIFVIDVADEDTIYV